MNLGAAVHSDGAHEPDPAFNIHMQKGSHHTPEARAAIASARRDAHAVTPEYASVAATARALLYSGEYVPAELLAMAREALALAPPGHTASWERVVDALEAGRMVRVKTYPVRILEPVPVDLVQSVEEIFE